MSNLVEKVAEAIRNVDYDEGGIFESHARAAIAVVLKEMDRWENLQPIVSAKSRPVVKQFALENGIEW